MIVYLAAYALIPLFGWSLATQIENRLARTGFAFLAGTLLLTIEATLFSIAGIHLQSNSAISTSSGFGITKLRPRAAVSRTALIITLGACPRIAGPQLPT